MFGEINPLILLAGLVAFGAVLALWLRHSFSEDARLRRRRRKNYAPTVSKGKGPTVKLAVKTDEPKH